MEESESKNQRDVKPPRISFMTRLQNFLEKLEAFRKVMLNLGVVLLVTFLLGFLVKTSFQEKLLVLPVEITAIATSKGYTPALFTEKILDRISFMKQKASKYYENNDIQLTMADEQVEIVNTLLSNTPLAGFKELITDFANRNQQIARGKIIQVNNKMQLSFRIEKRQPMEVESGDIDSLINFSAEYILEELNPYFLGAYLFQNKEYTKCLSLVSKLLNSEESKYQYLAFHLRGNIYIEMGDRYLKKKTSSDSSTGKEYLNYAKTILDSAIAKNNMHSPWLTYNSMGVIYQDLGAYDTAKIWYRKSIAAYSGGALAFYNYGNILKNQYDFDEEKYVANCDSAIIYYKQAIERNRTNITFKIKLLEAYVCANKTREAKDLFYICRDMDSSNKDIYYSMADLYTNMNDTAMAHKYMQLAESVNQKK